MPSLASAQKPNLRLIGAVLSVKQICISCLIAENGQLKLAAVLEHFQYSRSDYWVSPLH